MCPRRGNDPASGHPRAHQPPLGRGTSPPAWDGRLDAPGQRRRHLPSSAWTRRREVKQGKSGGSVGTTDQGKGKGRSVVRPMGTVAYRGKGQGKGKGRGEGRLGQGGRGRSKGGEKLMGTTAYGGKGSKGRAANGDRPVGAASCRRDHHTMASCQNPPPPVRDHHTMASCQNPPLSKADEIITPWRHAKTPPVQGKGSEWRSASRRRQLQTRSSHHGVMPKPPPPVAYRGKGQGKGKGRGEGRLGQGGRGRSKGGEKLMGTTAYGGKGSKGRAANGDRPVGAASCRREHHTMASCQNPPPPPVCTCQNPLCVHVHSLWMVLPFAVAPQICVNETPALHEQYPLPLHQSTAGSALNSLRLGLKVVQGPRDGQGLPRAFEAQWLVTICQQALSGLVRAT